MSKAKILLTPCQENLLRCEVKMAQIPKKNVCCKQIRTFSSTIECDNSMEGWSLRAEAPALSDFYSFQKQKTHY